jgi:hypothetical protein
MQIQGINGINKKNTTFGMAVKSTPEAKKFLSEYLSRRGLKNFEKLAKFAENDSIDVNIRTEQFPIRLNAPNVKYTQLIIDVGDGTKYSYKPVRISLFITNAIKKAVDKAHLLSENKKKLDNIGL